MCSMLHVTADQVSVCLLMHSACCSVHEASVESPMVWHLDYRQASLFGGSTHPLLQGSAG